MRKYVIWSKNNCRFCQEAKSFLLMRKADFEVKTLDMDYSMEEFVKLFPSARTFPAITCDGTYIGGFDQLKESY